MSNELPPASDYATILRNSIYRETVARMVCPACRQANHLRIRRVLTEDAPLPPVLVVNAGVRTSDELEIWLDGRLGPGKRFLEPAVEIERSGETVAVRSLADVRQAGNGVVYELQVGILLLPPCCAG